MKITIVYTNCHWRPEDTQKYVYQLTADIWQKMQKEKKFADETDGHTMSLIRGLTFKQLCEYANKSRFIDNMSMQDFLEGLIDFPCFKYTYVYDPYDPDFNRIEDGYYVDLTPDPDPITTEEDEELVALRNLF